MSTKILVIDDDESILDAVSLILQDEGYEVSSSIKGDEAVSLVHAFKPDVILLDVLMSGKDGREICMLLKRDASTRQIPIIMISAHPTAQADAKTSGADAFLAKPFDTDQLLKMISRYTSPKPHN